MTHDTLVLGAGLAGLATAALLARAGRRVTLLERSHSVGGRAITTIHDGFHLNLGPHALYLGGPAEQVLRDLGYSPRGKMVLPRKPVLLREGRLHGMPLGPVSLLMSSMFSIGEKYEVAKVLSTLERSDLGQIPRVTVQSWIDEHASSPVVREFLHTMVRLTSYTNAPSWMSARAALLQLQRSTQKGVMYLDDGWQAMVDGVSEIAKQSGVEIRTGAQVASVEHDGSVRGVTLTSGEHLTARTVIVAAAPSVAASLVRDNAALRAWSEAAHPVKAACLDLALTRLPVPDRGLILGLDTPVYGSVHTHFARLAPGDGVVVHLVNYLEVSRESKAEKKDKTHGAEPRTDLEADLDATMDLFQPGWRQHVVHRRFLPQLTVMNDVQGLDPWPGPEVPGIRGLYVVGDWVKGGEGLLLDASLSSARDAVRRSLESGDDHETRPVRVGASFAAHA